MIDIMTSVAILNEARSSELLSISQYMRFHYALDDQQYKQLAHAMKRIAIMEMRHAEYLGERIVEMGGSPTSAMAAVAGAAPSELYPIFVRATTLEDAAISIYTQAATRLRENDDYISEQLVKRILMEEEQHQQYFSRTQAVMDDVGPTFAAVQVSAQYSPADYAEYMGLKEDDD